MVKSFPPNALMRSSQHVGSIVDEERYLFSPAPAVASDAAVNSTVTFFRLFFAMGFSVLDLRQRVAFLFGV
jgi:hypothetical protein